MGCELRLQVGGRAMTRRLTTLPCVQNLQDEEKLAKELAVFAEVRLPRHEVEEYRDLFLAADKDDSGYLSFEEIRNLVIQKCPAGSKNNILLGEIYAQHVGGETDMQADFPA